MKRIELSGQAELRLKEITDYYLLHESVERTLKVLNSFDEAFTIISNNPFIYKKYAAKEFVNLDIEFIFILKHFTSTSSFIPPA